MFDLSLYSVSLQNQYTNVNYYSKIAIMEIIEKQVEKVKEVPYGYGCYDGYGYNGYIIFSYTVINIFLIGLLNTKYVYIFVLCLITKLIGEIWKKNLV